MAMRGLFLGMGLPDGTKDLREKFAGWRELMNKNTNNIQNFEKWIKTIAIYLGKFTGSNKEHDVADTIYTPIDSIEKYDGYLLKKYIINGIRPYNVTEPMYLEFVCVAGNNGQSESEYVRYAIESIFPVWQTDGRLEHFL